MKKRANILSLRQSSEEAEGLKTSNEKYRSLVETTDSGYVILDVNGAVLDANAEYVRLTGRERLEDIAGHNVLEWTASYNVERNSFEVRKCLERGLVRNLEIDYVSPLGRIIPVEVNATVVQTESSKIILALCRDITVRKREENLLREREQHLRLLTENMMDVISQVDAERRITYCSPSIERMIGYASSDLIGRHIYEYVHPDDIERLKREELQAVADAKPSLRVEYRYRNAWGGYGWMESVISLMYDNAGNFQGAILSSRDITERIKAEEAALEDRNLLFSIFRASPWGIGVIKKRIMLTINDRICEMTGYTREELIGKNARILYPSDVDYEFVGSEQYGQLSNQRIRTIETKWRHRNGQIINILMSASPIYPPDLSREITFTVLDITSRKKAEAEKEKLQAQLLQSQKMESIGRLAGGVAHDFNNMLSVILGRTELAAMESPSSDLIQEALAEIKTAAERSAALTRQLLAFARKQMISPVVLDLNEIVAGMHKMLARLIGEDIELSWKPGDNLWPIKIDPAQVDQVVANLAVNARDAIAGVGKIIIETSTAIVDEIYCSSHPGANPGEYVMLALSDTGRGMTADVQEHLFEPFFTTKAFGQGTGLGLATVYGIVQQNKGFIHVCSEVNQGATFRIFFPRAEAKTVEKPLPKLEPSHHGFGETILLVEDEESVLNISRIMLERNGYAVMTANCPAEAIRLSESFSGKIDLVITDLIMPGMNGKDLATKLQAARPDLACLFISGYSYDVIQHHKVLDSGSHFLSKPFSLNDLTRKVCETINAR